MHLDVFYAHAHKSVVIFVCDVTGVLNECILSSEVNVLRKQGAVNTV